MEFLKPFHAVKKVGYKCTPKLDRILEVTNHQELHIKEELYFLKSSCYLYRYLRGHIRISGIALELACK